MPLFRKKKQNNRGLMALAGETAKMARNMMVLDKTEAALEREMEKEEKRTLPSTKIGKIRRKGEHMIHGKYILLMVVILNVIDCLLVLGELMLDIKYVTDLLTKEYDRSDKFIASMKEMYPGRLSYLGSEDIEGLEHEILKAELIWKKFDTTTVQDTNNDVTSGNGHTTSGPFNALHSSTPHSDLTSDNNLRKRRASIQESPGVSNITSNYTDHSNYQGAHHHAHSIEEDIAHGLHKASITILGILVVETFFKIFCLGRVMLEHKLECFDGFIVIASFIVDIVFIKGLQQFTVQEFVLILAFMVPWRIIRVVNSLVVAIMDHEHFRLVLLYKQKKKISQELKDTKDEVKGLEACVDVLKKLCKDAGLPDSFVDARLNMYRKVKAKANVMGALSGFALGGDAMNKPFTNVHNGNTTNIPNGHTTQPSIVVNLDEVNITADTDKVIPNSENKSGTLEDIRKLSVPNGYTNEAFEGDRRRSYSATDPREIQDREKNELLKKLAESSAQFIATINKDDVDLSEDTIMEKIAIITKQRQSQKSAADEDAKTNDKSDTETLVKDDRDNDHDSTSNGSDGGQDNLATQL